MKFERVKQQNFYVHIRPYWTLLKSYNTIVGIIHNGELFQTKWSRTTSKQISQYANSLEIPTKYRNTISSDELHDIIKKITGLNIDTRYNCA